MCFLRTFINIFPRVQFITNILIFLRLFFLMIYLKMAGGYLEFLIAENRQYPRKKQKQVKVLNHMQTSK